jgi:peptidoglycan/LPS O-acetylase OafA/YrhL
MLVSEQARHQFPWIRRLLESNWMVSIGRVSYGMYIFHWAIMVYVVERIFPVHEGRLRMLFFIPYVLVVYLFSKLSFRYFESYFIKLKDKA